MVRGTGRGFLIGEKLRKVMIERALSQSELSKITGLSQAVISQYLNNKRAVSPRHLEIISKALNLPISYFLEEDDEKKGKGKPAKLIMLEQLIMQLPEEKREKVLKALIELLEAIE